MKTQQGSTLIVSLVLLTIITLVVAYALEGSNIQSKMVANSLFTSLTYQECRNEQEANVQYYNSMDVAGSSNRNILLTSMDSATKADQLTTSITKGTGTSRATAIPPKSDKIEIDWTFVREAPGGRSGYDIDSESQNRAYLFDHECIATYRFSKNDQTLGAIVTGLKQAGNIN